MSDWTGAELVNKLRLIDKERKLFRCRACKFIRKHHTNIRNRFLRRLVGGKISRGSYLGDFNDLKLIEILGNIGEVE